MGLSPESVTTWIGVTKNLVLIAIGVFIIVHETMGYDPPSVLLLLTAAASLGLPVLDYLSTVKKG